MSIRLTNQHGEIFQTTNIAWARMLTLARVAGWLPAGTVPSENWEPEDPEEPWDPLNYWTQDAQEVCTEDARSLGAALEQAHPHIPENPPASPRAFYNEEELMDFITLWSHVIAEMREAFELDSPTLERFGWLDIKPERVLNLAHFCRNGGFWIT